MGMDTGRDKLKATINIAPLVDVCLVLLIIFMVITPMLQKGVAVQLPQASNPDKKPEGGKQKLISVKWSSPPAYYLESKPVTRQDLQTQLDELFQRAPQTDLVIKGDQRLKYGDVKEVMKITKESGFQNVGLIAEKKVSAGG
ncbi:MAG: ExbD/TolR family protein [Thermoanaerobaculia bacterium]